MNTFISSPALFALAKTPLVLARSGLARFLCHPISLPLRRDQSPVQKSTYQLVQIPGADLHTPTILIQAVGKALSSRLTALLRPVVVLVTLLGLRGHCIIVCLPLSYISAARVTATEHATDGVTDR